MRLRPRFQRSFLPRTVAVATLVLSFLVLVVGCQIATTPSPPPKLPRVGYLSGGTPESAAPNVGAFRDGLRELGYVEGETILLDVRYAEGRNERYPELVADLLGAGAEVLVTVATTGSMAARQASGTVPIVFVSVGNPVEVGLVQSLSHPGGSVTGLSSTAQALNPKRLQLLKDALPGLTRMAVLRDASNPTQSAPLSRGDLPTVAASLGIQLHEAWAHGPEGLPGAFEQMRSSGAQAFIDIGCPMTCTHYQEVVRLAGQHRLPAMYSFGHYVRAGGLMAYGVSDQAMNRRAATYIDKILKGAKPADLPVEQPTEFDFVVNPRAAELLGLTLPPSHLLQATEIVP